MEKKNAWEKYPEGTKRQDVFTFAEEYRKFISSCKTERECAGEFYRKAKEAGFADLSEKIAQNTKLKADRKSTRLNSSHKHRSRMPSSA